MTKITEALEKLFTKHRVIFWYDEKQELVDQFADVDLFRPLAIERISIYLDDGVLVNYHSLVTLFKWSQD
jgi:hypothetical protein